MRAKTRPLVLKWLTTEHNIPTGAPGGQHGYQGQIANFAPTSVREVSLGTASYGGFLWKALFKERVPQL